MAQTNFNVGTSPNDGTGEPLRQAFQEQQAMNTELYSTKVDKVTGKGLSTEDFTNDLKVKLSGIAPGAEVNVQPDWNQADNTQDDFIKNKPDLGNSQEYKTANFTAENGIFYTVKGSGIITITDPVNFTGQGYIVYVLSGFDVVIGADTFIIGCLIYRFYNGSAWVSKDVANIYENISLFSTLATKLTKSGDTLTGDIGNIGTGFFRLPSGTTAQRPGAPLNGMMRFNTDTSKTEVYLNAVWRNQALLDGDTFTGAVSVPSLIVSAETANRIASLDGSKNIKSLDTATYPSLSELVFLKGVSSAIQTQLDLKVNAASPVFTSTLTFNSGTQTANNPAVNVSQTWNNAAVAFTAFLVAITDTASQNTSKLFDLTVGGTSRFTVGAGGEISRCGSIVSTGRISCAQNTASQLTTILSNGSFSNSSGTIKGYDNNEALIFTGGTAEYIAIDCRIRINQTSGSVGLIRGFYFNPVLTSLLGELRALDIQAGKIVFSSTITALGTTGAQTINKISGKVNAAAGTTSLVVTNNLVTASSIVMAQMGTNDSTCRITSVVEAAGSFTIHYIAPTAETVIKFKVIN